MVTPFRAEAQETGKSLAGFADLLRLVGLKGNL
jgi:hypothetical protein